MTIRHAGWVAVLALTAAAGCDDGPASGEVTGTVTVDGKVPAEGSSITFIPSDGKTASAGDVIKDGKYSAKVPVGNCKVEIRVPRPAGKQTTNKEGPGGGPGGGGLIEESLPARYNDKTELTFEVKRGKNEKNWDLSTK
jgi:hypothetical protein